jgi:GT2 family glycosyltransferase
MSDRISIVILNWNQYDFTSECLRSLRELTYPCYDIWVVDNASEDGSPERLGRDFPEVKLIRNSENLGVAGGRNAGVRRVLEYSPEPKYILMLDNDTVVEPNLLEELVKIAEKDERIGLVTCKVVFYDNPGIINAAGIHFYPIIFHARARGGGRTDDGRWDRPREVYATPGCVQFIRSSVFRTVGLYDIAFSPNGPEDWEFGLRARKYGYKTFYTPATRVLHKLSAKYKKTPRHTYNITKANIIFMRKYCGWYQVWIAFLFFLVHRLIRQIIPFLCSRSYEKIGACFKGVRDGLRFEI